EEGTRVDDLRGFPMGVGSLEEIIDDDHAIVYKKTRYVVVDVLQDDTYPMVSVLKLEKAPTKSRADIGVLEQQIQGIKESVNSTFLSTRIDPKLVRKFFHVTEEHAPSIVFIVKLMLLELN
ncbi:14457_t:CDS:2, partial [Cetraspora pellucida]